MRISIKTVPYSEMSRTTAADWKIHEDGSVEIWAVETDDWKMSAIVLFHELAEIFFCKMDGITSKEADAFDDLWEKELAEGRHRPEEEAGCDPRCPYRLAHRAGMFVESVMCFVFGVHEEDYKDFWDCFFIGATPKV